MKYLLDTNVLAELRKRKPNENVEAWIRSADRGSLYTSVLVLGEIRRGCEYLRRRDPAQAAALDRWLSELCSEFADRILPVTLPITESWGRLCAPDRLSTVDGLISATALAHGLTVATRNTEDFIRSGVPCVDPFAPSRG
ncbi:type II toxin-antitoxin system VapC family toxin [Nocardiopsis sp. CNT-189]|uniref:type II toxin-antitoxin system VapC family toxin n=1 Tax=Nocardiopsis oceanisediminis TaxID=2816862 RepID=UPI003B367956